MHKKLVECQAGQVSSGSKRGTQAAASPVGASNLQLKGHPHNCTTRMESKGWRVEDGGWTVEDGV